MRPTPYEIEVGGYTIRCADARALRDLLGELGETRKGSRARRDADAAAAAKNALLDEAGHYRAAISMLVAHHPGGIFAGELLTKAGFQDNPKGFGGFMTGLRKRLKEASLGDEPIRRTRKKNGTGWKNYFELDDKAAETMRRWLEG